MKITKSYLKQVIKEELENFEENLLSKGVEFVKNKYQDWQDNREDKKVNMRNAIALFGLSGNEYTKYNLSAFDKRLIYQTYMDLESGKISEDDAQKIVDDFNKQRYGQMDDF